MVERDQPAAEANGPPEQLRIRPPGEAPVAVEPDTAPEAIRRQAAGCEIIEGTLVARAHHFQGQRHPPAGAGHELEPAQVRVLGARVGVVVAAEDQVGPTHGILDRAHRPRDGGGGAKFHQKPLPVGAQARRHGTDSGTLFSLQEPQEGLLSAAYPGREVPCWGRRSHRRSNFGPGSLSGKPPVYNREVPITRPQHDRRLLLVLSLLTLAAGSGSARGATEGWLQRLQDKLDSLQTFRATFVQEYEPRAFSRRQRESGTVHFQKPGKMRWEYEFPETKLALSDGQRVWIYYPQERRAEVGLLDQLGDSSPAVQILMGRWRLRERFRVQSLERKGSEVTLNLVPREQEAVVKAVRITVREPDLALTVLEAEEPGGNVLRYRFEDWQEGIETSADFFLFTPPPGTRVQEIR